MFNWIKRKLTLTKILLSQPPEPKVPPYPTKSLNKKVQYLKNQFAESPDFVIRPFNIGVGAKIRACLFFVDGLVDREALEERVMKPLIDESTFANIAETELSPFEAITNHLILSAEMKIEKEFHQIVECVLQGETGLIIDGHADTIVLGHRKWQTRAISEPDSEKAVQGPREGFVETLRVNTSLLRRTIHDPNLVLEMSSVGVRTKTAICIAYIKGVARPEIVAELKRRLKSFVIDGVFAAGYLEELIRDAPYSPFKTIAVSERPDKIAGKILEGRIAIIVDGTPFVITLPNLFIENFQVPGDYSGPFIFQSLLRLLRFTGFFLSIFTVPIYIALTAFHQELLPNFLAFSLAAAREGSPFPATIEALILSLFFEILREAGVRMPAAIGGAVNIVGALVIGEAAVNAGLVGAPMVIVMAVTAIANFIVPSLIETSTILRYFFLFLVALLGFYGLLMGIFVVLLHVTSLYSFGVPYLSPISPFIPRQMGDVFVRVPFWLRVFRPGQFAIDKQRADFRLEHLKKNNQGENH